MATAATPHPASLRVTVGRFGFCAHLSGSGPPLDFSLGGAVSPGGAFSRWPLRSPRPELLAGKAGAVDQRFELRPHDLRMHAGEIGHLREAAVRACDHVLAPDEAGQPDDALGDEFGMLDDVGGVTDHAGNQRRILRQLELFPQSPFMLVARIGELDRVSAGAYLQHEVGDILERDVGRVRAGPTSPADMVPDLVARQSLDGMVDDLDLPPPPTAVLPPALLGAHPPVADPAA